MRKVIRGLPVRLSWASDRSLVAYFMCGIAGFVNPSLGLSKLELEELALKMVATLRHRGPDDHGVWAEPAAGISLGHRRLAIQDLSAEGHQPMQSADGRYILIYNGEIYNFYDIKSDLEKAGHRFRGHSDTEVMSVGGLTVCSPIFAPIFWLAIAYSLAAPDPLHS